MFEEKSEPSQLLPRLDCQNHLYCIASYEFGNKLLLAAPLCELKTPLFDSLTNISTVDSFCNNSLFARFSLSETSAFSDKKLLYILLLTKRPLKITTSIWQWQKQALLMDQTLTVSVAPKDYIGATVDMSQLSAEVIDSNKSKTFGQDLHTKTSKYRTQV